MTATRLPPLRAAVAIALIAVAGVGAFLLNTNNVPLADPDEGRYAEIGREMLGGGDWIVPRLFDLPYLEKPPLLYWLTALAFKLFGLSEFAARLAPALAAGLGLSITGMFASRLFPPRVGVLATMVLATSLLYFAIARMVITDMLFGVLISAALMAFLLAQRGKCNERVGYIACWLFAAGAMLTKGPTGPGICAVVIFLELALARSWKTLMRASFWLGFPLFVIVALPWFLMVEQRHKGYLYFYIVKEHLLRAGGAEHKQPFWWFAPILLLGLLPWTFLALAAAPAWLRTVRNATLPEGSNVRFLLIWSAVVFMVFSAAGGKLIPYIVPMFPPVAILIASFLDRALGEDPAAHARLLPASILTCATLLVLAAVMFVVPPKMKIDVPVALRLAMTVPLVLTAASTLAWSSRLGSSSVAATAVGMTLFYVGLAHAMPAVGDAIMTRPQIRRLETMRRPGDEIALVHVYLPSVAFYTRRVPYVVGAKGELLLGSSLAAVGTPQRFIADVTALRNVPASARVFCLAHIEQKRGPEVNLQLQELDASLRQHAGGVQKLAANTKSELMLITRGTPTLAASSAANGR